MSLKSPKKSREQKLPKKSREQKHANQHQIEIGKHKKILGWKIEGPFTLVHQRISSEEKSKLASPILTSDLRWKINSRAG